MFADGIDPSGAGFTSIFGSDADSPPDTQDVEPTSPDEATAADSPTPEETDDGQDLSAEDIVAARFADEMAEAGADVDTPDEDEETEEPDEGAFDFESLTEEEKAAFIAEAIAARTEQQTTSEQAAFAAVQAKALEAEEQAEALVAQQFEREVLGQSEAWFGAEAGSRIRQIVAASRNADDPDTFIIQNVLLATDTVWKARIKWEREQSQDWGQVAEDARIAARQNAPEVREYVAKHLARKFNLPETAVADIASPNRHILAFEQRAQELADMAKFAGKKQKEATNAKRQDANRKLKAQPVRTSSTGRLSGGKPKEYKGEADEFVAIMRYGSGS